MNHKNEQLRIHEHASERHKALYSHFRIAVAAMLNQAIRGKYSGYRLLG